MVLTRHNVESNFGVGLFPCGAVNHTEPLLGSYVLEVNLAISSIVFHLEHLIGICSVIGNLCDTIFVRSDYKTARYAIGTIIILSDEVVVSVNERITFCVDNSFSCSQSSQFVRYLRFGLACSMRSLNYIKSGLQVSQMIFAGGQPINRGALVAEQEGTIPCRIIVMMVGRSNCCKRCLCISYVCLKCRRLLGAVDGEVKAATAAAGNKVNGDFIVALQIQCCLVDSSSNVFVRTVMPASSTIDFCAVNINHRIFIID